MAKDKFHKSTEGKALLLHIRQYFDETILRSLSKQEKKRHIQKFSQNLGRIMTLENPFYILSRALGGSAYGYAELQVFCLKPEKSQMCVTRRTYLGNSIPTFVSAKTM